MIGLENGRPHWPKVVNLMRFISADLGRSGLRYDLNVLQDRVPCNREAIGGVGVTLSPHPG